MDSGHIWTGVGMILQEILGWFIVNLESLGWWWEWWLGDEKILYTCNIFEQRLHDIWKFLVSAKASLGRSLYVNQTLIVQCLDDNQILRGGWTFIVSARVFLGRQPLLATRRILLANLPKNRGLPSIFLVVVTIIVTIIVIQADLLSNLLTFITPWSFSVSLNPSRMAHLQLSFAHSLSNALQFHKDVNKIWGRNKHKKHGETKPSVLGRPVQPEDRVRVGQIFFPSPWNALCCWLLFNENISSEKYVHRMSKHKDF